MLANLNKQSKLSIALRMCIQMHCRSRSLVQIWNKGLIDWMTKICQPHSRFDSVLQASTVPKRRRFEQPSIREFIPPSFPKIYTLFVSTFQTIISIDGVDLTSLRFQSQKTTRLIRLWTMCVWAESNSQRSLLLKEVNFNALLLQYADAGNVHIAYVKDA